MKAAVWCTKGSVVHVLGFKSGGRWSGDESGDGQEICIPIEDRMKLGDKFDRLNTK